jgi:hypothetical protein
LRPICAVTRKGNPFNIPRLARQKNTRMSAPIISYAQNQEDVILHCALREVGQGFYIDVGAQHPVVDSVTKLFYEQGWRGINIDPMPQWVSLLQADRPRDINLQMAAGAQRGQMSFFFFF